jgi:hypothetical protein
MTGSVSLNAVNGWRAVSVNKEFICYCGLYCENCAVMAKVTPASKVLYNEMLKAGFEEVIHQIPGGDGFWPFLKNMATFGACLSCKSGGADPSCAIRICAKEKLLEACAFCVEYPCEKFSDMLMRNPILKQDNVLLRNKGIEVWAKLQDERRVNGFTYQETE